MSRLHRYVPSASDPLAVDRADREDETPSVNDTEDTAAPFFPT